MHADISDWSSGAMYEGRLEAGEAVRARLLADLPHVEETEETSHAMVVIDTTGSAAPPRSVPLTRVERAKGERKERKRMRKRETESRREKRESTRARARSSPGPHRRVDPPSPQVRHGRGQGRGRVDAQRGRGRGGPRAPRAAARRRRAGEWLQLLAPASLAGNGSNSSPPPPSRPLQTHLLRRVRGRQAPAPERKTSLISGGLSQ
mgnify:CR=1 FL=1